MAFSGSDVWLDIRAGVRGKALERQTGQTEKKGPGRRTAESGLPWPQSCFWKFILDAVWEEKRKRRKDWMQGSTLELLSSPRQRGDSGYVDGGVGQMN